jgi:hypothetical protein
MKKGSVEPHNEPMVMVRKTGYVPAPRETRHGPATEGGSDRAAVHPKG